VLTAVATPKPQSLWASVVAGVEFTPGYVAFLAYIAVTTTLTVPVASAAMAVATLAMLVPQPGGYRVPPVLRWMAAFTAWCAVGFASTNYPDVAWDALYAFLKIGVIAFVAANVLRTRPQIMFFIVFSLACYAFFPARAGILAYFAYGGSAFGGRTAWKGHLRQPERPRRPVAAAPVDVRGAVLRVAQPRDQNRQSGGRRRLALVVLLTQSRGALVAMLGLPRGRPGYDPRQGTCAAPLRPRSRRVVAIPLIPQSALDASRHLQGGANTEQLKDVGDQGSAEQRFEIWKVARTITAENRWLAWGSGRTGWSTP
jgi:hypothetical protein